MMNQGAAMNWQSVPGEKRVKLENWQSMKIAGYYFAIFDFCQLQRQDARAKLLKIQA